MTAKEVERLQTLPDNYTELEGVTEPARIEVVGNGWTVDVITHLLSGFHREEKGG